MSDRRRWKKLPDDWHADDDYITDAEVLAEMGARTVKVCSICLESQQGYDGDLPGCWNCDAPVVEAWLVVKEADDE